MQVLILTNFYHILYKLHKFDLIKMENNIKIVKNAQKTVKNEM